MHGELIGAFRSRGVTKPEDSDREIEYDNLVVLFKKPFEPLNMPSTIRENGVGFMTVEAKCPFSHWRDVFGGKIEDISQLDDWVGAVVSYYFNDKKKLDEVRLD